jgi:hypothetical protein
MPADCLGRALLIATGGAVRHGSRRGEKSRKPCTISAVSAPHVALRVRAERLALPQLRVDSAQNSNLRTIARRVAALFLRALVKFSCINGGACGKKTAHVGTTHETSGCQHALSRRPTHRRK